MNMFAQFARSFDGDRVLAEKPLFVGSVPEDRTALETVGITHIVTVGSEQHLTPQWPSRFRYLRIYLEDEPAANLVSAFDEATAWIHAALEANGCVLVHCAAGISRSVTIVCAYLLRYHGDRFLSATHAVSHVQKARPWASPNHGFLKQLKLHHDILLANTPELRKLAEARLSKLVLDDKPKIEYHGPDDFLKTEEKERKEGKEHNEEQSHA